MGVVTVVFDYETTSVEKKMMHLRHEHEDKSIKHNFLAKTSSKDYRVRLFYFVFAVLLYNIWRLTDFLLKAGVDDEMDYAPVLTAGE